MTLKFWKAMRSMGILSLLFLLIISCSEDDLNTIDAGFIDNLNFISKEIISEVEFSSEAISKVESQINGQFLLGVFEEKNISKIRGSFVSQLILPSDIYVTDDIREANEIETTLHIDDVVLYLPYHSTVKSIDNEVYTYKLDSVFPVAKDGVDYDAFSFEVHELETFLNPLNPSNPSLANVYYSDKEYVTKTLLATETNYVPSAFDTETNIDRYSGGGDEIIENITLTNNAPRMAIPLDKNYFKTQVLEKLPLKGGDISSHFQSQESFNRYFRGLYVKVISSDGASIVTLPLTDAFVDMYYTYEEEVISTGVKSTVAKTMRFNLGGVKAVKYESIGVETQETDKIYLQGTSGFLGNIRLFGYDESDPTNISMELDTLRNGKESIYYANDLNGNSLWLINEANLLFYVNGTERPNINKLFLYKKVPEINNVLPYNSQLLDYLTASNLSSVEGSLYKDENDEYYYKFKLTDYITELLEGTNTKNVDNLGLKIYNPGDYPTNDTLIRSSSWNPRGVVLDGDDLSGSGVKRTVLKINYSYQNR